MISISTASLGLGLLFIVESVQAQKQCYWPNHSTAVNFTACNAAADQSSCCRNSEACMTNGLCLQTQGLANRLARGACTDSTWSSAACTQTCDDVVTDGSLTVFLAYDDQVNNGAFCCVLPYNTTSSECEVASHDTTTPFDLDPFQIIVDRSTGATLPLNGSDASTSANTSASTVTSTVTTTAGSSSNITAVAAGIAAPLGILLIAALLACGILFSQLRKLRREHGPTHVAQDGHGMPGHHQGSAPSYDYKSVPQEHQSHFSPTWAPQPASPAPQSAPVEAGSGRELSEADSTPVKSVLR